MSRNIEHQAASSAAPDDVRDTTESSEDDDETFSTNLQDISIQDRTFQNILAVLVGRQSLRSFRTNLSPGSPDTSDSDDEDQWWNFQPRPSPATHHPPDTSSIRQCEISLLSGRSRQPGKSITSVLAQRSLSGALSTACQQSILSRPSLLPQHGSRVAQYNKKVFCGRHARQGDIFITACPDKIRVYDTTRERFKLFHKIQPRDVGWSVLDVAVSPEGRDLVYSSWSDCLHAVRIREDGEEAEDVHQSLPLRPGDLQFCVFSISFSSDSRELLCGANDGCLYVYDREANTQTSRIPAHHDDVNAVCFVDDTTHVLVSGGDDGVCKVWDRRALREEDPQPVGVLAGHSDGITYIDPRGDGRHLISNSKDQSIKLWDIRRFSSQSAVERSRVVVSDQKWDYRWQRVPRNVVRSRTRLEGDSSVMTYTGHTILQTLIRCHFSPQHSTGQNLIYTGCAAGRVLMYDLLTGEIVKILSGHKGCVRDVSWHPYNPELLSSSWDFTVRRWRAVTESSSEKNSRASEGQEETRPGREKKRRLDLSD